MESPIDPTLYQPGHPPPVAMDTKTAFKHYVSTSWKEIGKPERYITLTFLVLGGFTLLYMLLTVTWDIIK